ncbi:hypothetical protein D030_1328B, partial [Vibrio parahaemolyticus AQ3810]
ASV